MTLEELAYGLAPLTSGLYILYDQDGNFYYGSTVNLRFRLQSHHRELKNQTHRNVRVQRSFNKYGLQAEVIQLCPTSNLLNKEKELILSAKLYAPLKCMNVSLDPYCPVRGIQPTREQVQKSAETRRGQKRTEEQKERMGKPKRGKKQNLEVVESRTLGRTGGRRVWFISPNGTIYGPIVSIRRFSHIMNISSLQDVANGRRAGSYGWRLRTVSYY